MSVSFEYCDILLMSDLFQGQFPQRPFCNLSFKDSCIAWYTTAKSITSFATETSLHIYTLYSHVMMMKYTSKDLKP